MSTTTSHPTPTATEDRPAILDLIARLGLLTDARDWNALEQLFTDPIYSDRTSLFGGEPQTNTPAELAGGLQYVLGKLDRTHHLISCEVINLDGDEATGAANMQARTCSPTPPAAPSGSSPAATTISSNGRQTAGGSPRSRSRSNGRVTTSTS
jgi:SnoaL-like domain